MRSTGITRKVDGLGRIVIPKEVRSNIALAELDFVEFFVEGDSVIIKKYQTKCIFCGNDNQSELGNFKGKTICLNCINEIPLLNE